jgi:hypothetical protein
MKNPAQMRIDYLMKIKQSRAAEIPVFRPKLQGFGAKERETAIWEMTVRPRFPVDMAPVKFPRSGLQDNYGRPARNQTCPKALRPSRNGKGRPKERPFNK